MKRSKVFDVLYSEFWMQWRDVLRLLPFVRKCPGRPIMEGVHVEFDPNEDELLWAARLVATDGKRLAVLESTVRAGTNWKFDRPTSFLLPLEVIKRVKKPGQDGFPEVRVTVEWGPPTERKLEDADEDAAEKSIVTLPDILAQRVQIDAVHDPLRVSGPVPEDVYPDWRLIVPRPPYKPASDATVDGGLAADFSAVVGAIEQNAGIRFYRSKADDEQSALLVRSVCQRFLGVLMPMKDFFGDEDLQLPLWVDESS